ncbi:hypothetical protein FN846DRAFT_942025 [Sphaerosporella brunnea]|uniref:Uncharacterized protein n=1 Tax=Sphaerosporella brunnea TaxID=1250544 RepID=A0A5J5F1H5_9PEZI|nr:hypothetical protein FN846DRAFT_942025 [Sphaerosporella brunnea]
MHGLGVGGTHGTPTPCTTLLVSCAVLRFFISLGLGFACRRKVSDPFSSKTTYKQTVENRVVRSGGSLGWSSASKRANPPRPQQSQSAVCHGDDRPEKNAGGLLVSSTSRSTASERLHNSTANFCTPCDSITNPWPRAALFSHRSLASKDILVSALRCSTLPIAIVLAHRVLEYTLSP